MSEASNSIDGLKPPGQIESTKAAEKQDNPSNYRRKIVELIEKGPNPQDTYAWHGTAIESLFVAAQTGKLPAQGSFGHEFYFVPEGIDPDEPSQHHAEFYAEWNAKKYYILGKLPYRPEDMEMFGNVMGDHTSDPDEREAIYAEAEKHGISRTEFIKLKREAAERRAGVVVTLSKQLEKDFDVHGYRFDKDQRWVVVPSGGLSLDYISGILPLTPGERLQLLKLKDPPSVETPE